MAVAAIAKNVDHHILVKALSIGNGQPGNANRGLGVISIDVKIGACTDRARSVG
jgi:hypothetical protein